MANVLVERHGRVLEVTLAWPEKRNALSQEMCEAIVAACEGAESDDAIGAILWKAQGPMFCAGMNLDEALGPDAAGATEIHTRLFSLGARLTKPIVCAVNGPALGGGLGLVANSHIAVCSHGASFGLPEIRIGMWPYTIWAAVERVLGERRTLELALSSKVFNTPEAFQWGLVHEVVPPFELDDRVEAIAETLANASTETVQRGMLFVRERRGLSADVAGALALSMREENFASLDFEEGVKAMREKRSPRWPSQG
jgi:enoyl-CoA hydratase/carnithine racemase